MADIKQAAKWMNAGKKVTGGNAIWPLSGDNDYIFFHPLPGKGKEPYVMGTSDLLADDWEIAE